MNTKRNKINTRTMVIISALSAIAVILQLVEMPVNFAPQFLKLDFSDIPALIGAFSLGPFAGALIELLKNLLFVIVRGTNSGMIGEVANFAIGSALVVPAGIIYKRNKNFKNAVLALIVSVFSFVLAGYILNKLLLFPLYEKIFMPRETIIAMGNAINKNVSTIDQVLLFTVVPFNFVKAILESIITLVLYKPISPIIKGKSK